MRTFTSQRNNVIERNLADALWIFLAIPLVLSTLNFRSFYATPRVRLVRILPGFRRVRPVAVMGLLSIGGRLRQCAHIGLMLCGLPARSADRDLKVSVMARAAARAAKNLALFSLVDRKHVERQEDFAPLTLLQGNIQLRVKDLGLMRGFCHNFRAGLYHISPANEAE